MRAKYYFCGMRIPRQLFDYLCMDKPTGIVRDLLAWLCVALGQCFMALARWHLETGLWLAGDSVRMRLMRHLEHQHDE